MDFTKFLDFLKNSISRRVIYETPTTSQDALLKNKQTSNFEDVFVYPQKTQDKTKSFQPINDWIIYRRFENQILQAVKQKIKEQYGVGLPTSLEDKLKAKLFSKSLELGIFRFTDQDTLRYIKFVENPKALIPYFATLEKYAPTTRGTILTPSVKQELGLKETEDFGDLMEFIQNLQQLQQK